MAVKHPRAQPEDRSRLTITEALVLLLFYIQHLIGWSLLALPRSWESSITVKPQISYAINVLGGI